MARHSAATWDRGATGMGVADIFARDYYRAATPNAQIPRGKSRNVAHGRRLFKNATCGLDP